MDIDLEKLPVPDWGLACPACGYPLRGLPGHRCPECGTEIDIAELVRPWTRLRDPRFTGRERPLPDYGLACAACGEALAGATAHACPQCGEPFDLEALRPAREWFVLDRELCGPLPITGVQALLWSEGIPYAQVNEQTLAEIWGGQSILATQLRVPSEFYFEVLWLVRQARQEMLATQEAREAGKSKPWRCAQCGAQNPMNFDICWKCQHAKNNVGT